MNLYIIILQLKLLFICYITFIYSTMHVGNSFNFQVYLLWSNTRALYVDKPLYKKVLQCHDWPITNYPRNLCSKHFHSGVPHVSVLGPVKVYTLWMSEKCLHIVQVCLCLSRHKHTVMGNTCVSQQLFVVSSSHCHNKKSQRSSDDCRVEDVLIRGA